jgi:hypothetical protein
LLKLPKLPKLPKAFRKVLLALGFFDSVSSSLLLLLSLLPLSPENSSALCQIQRFMMYSPVCGRTQS